MHLSSGSSFWSVRGGLPTSFPSLDRDIEADVAVIGAGITGALIAHRLVSEGYSVVVLDKRDAGWGSTRASTALIQYEIDEHMTALSKRYSEDVAAKAYLGCVDAIEKLFALGKTLKTESGLKKSGSFYFASKAKDVKGLLAEYELRKKHGINVEFWERDVIEQRFDFSAPAGIYSHCAATLDPYRLAYELLNDVRKRGGLIFDRTEIRIKSAEKSKIHLKTTDGRNIRTCDLIIAAGYESLAFLPEKNIAKLHSSFALATEPIPEMNGWFEQCMIWESSRPYLYLRATDDGRMIAGGEDVPFRNEVARDKLLPAKIAVIEKRLRRMFPHMHLVRDFSWAGTFAETEDGLPFVGEHKKRPGLNFALCYGGNGITYSVLAADIIAANLAGKKHHLAELFSFERLK